MKLFLLLAMLLPCVGVFAQKISFNKDTIYVGAKDTVREVEFTVTGTTVGRNPRVTIITGDGEAENRVEFALVDGDEHVDTIPYLPLKNRKASFSLYTAGGLKETKSALFYFVIYSNGRRAVTKPATLILAPQKKPEAAAPAAPAAPKSDSLVIGLYQRDIVSVYKGSEKASEKDKEKEGEEISSINIENMYIEQRADRQFYITVFTTEHEKYSYSIKADEYGNFDPDNDKLYLNGKKTGNYLKAVEFLDTWVNKAGKDSRNMGPIEWKIMFKFPFK